MAPSPQIAERPLRPVPWPSQGLNAGDFRCVGKGGLGDGHNSYAHSMAWFEGKLYLGTTRSNLCMLLQQTKMQNVELPLAVWPVECPETMEGLYRLDRRAQIWAYDPVAESWEMAFRAPLVDAIDGNGKAPREIGYRAMEIFQAPNDPKPALYIAAWSPGRSPGGLLLRTYEGRIFEPVSAYGIVDPPIQITRNLTAFGGRTYFAPTARRLAEGFQQNTAGLPVIFGSPDPGGRDWQIVNEPGFGDPGNIAIFTLVATDERLYAGTFNLGGFQVWASDCRGEPPYHWHKIVDRGAGRGPLNQAVAAMTAFKGAVYVGTGIQGGGFDRENGVGPAAAEIIRVNPDDGWDLIVADQRPGEAGRREPLSGLRAGFGNFFNGYMWVLAEHAGWLYAGTYDWAVTLRWALADKAPAKVRRLFELLDRETVIANEGGADLWRTADGENWLPVTRQGFGNVYNIGVRNIVSSPHGLFVGTANLFGPRVAVRDGDGWRYVDNPDGGLEVWLGGAPVSAAGGPREAG